MGWFGGLVSRVGGAIKSAASKVVEKTKEAYNSVKEKVTNTWGKFTGKETFEEAERLYEKISSRYNQKRTEFDNEVNRITNSIENHVNAINTYKSRIKTELFVEMAKNLEKIRGIEFSKDFKLDEFKNKDLSFDSIRSKTDLYKIDFNKNKFKTTVQAVFTLGFFTRKKAKETLYAVQEEEYKVNAEIAKMDAELVKLKAIETSLKNVEYYFSSLIEIYEQLLVRLDNSVNYLYFKCMHFAHKLIKQEMKIKRLPLIQQKEVEAMMIASKILKEMAETQIVALNEDAKIVKYEKEMKSKQVEIVKVFEAA
jgi:hypothetical protein